MGDGNDNLYQRQCDTPRVVTSAAFSGSTIHGRTWWVVRGELTRLMRVYSSSYRAEVAVRLRERGYPLMGRPSGWMETGLGTILAR